MSFIAEEMVEMFQLGKHKEAKGRKREIQGLHEPKGKEETDPREQGGEREKCWWMIQ